MESFYNQTKGVVLSRTNRFLLLKRIEDLHTMSLLKEILVSPPAHKLHCIINRRHSILRKFFTHFLLKKMKCLSRLCAQL